MTGTMARHKQKLRSLLINAIIDLCRKESFYLEELRIEGTLCVVSDRSSALIMQITEQVGEKTTSDTDPEDPAVQMLVVANDEQSSSTHEDATKLLASEVNLDKLDHNVGSWLLEEQHGQPSDLLQQTVAVRMEGKHQCPFCPKRYRFKHSLKDHINKHTGNRPHHCKYCNLCFMHLGSLCAHVKRRHAQFMLPEYQCRICNEMFMSEQFLKQHYTWKHKGEKVPTLMGSAQFPVVLMDDANKVNVTATDLNKESPRSTMAWNSDAAKSSEWNPGAAPNANGIVAEPGTQSTFPTVIKTEPSFANRDEFFQGRDIGAVSGHGSNSSMHFNTPAVNMGFQQMAHTLSMFSSFPFTRGCNPLGSFSPFTPSYQQNVMNSMISGDPTKMEDGSTLQRSADGKFQCPYCEKSYNFKHTLKDHINKHLGKRPHICKHCGDTFVHLASLCAHIKRRHDEQMPTEFRCEICQEKLMNYQSLKQHYTWRHRESRMFMEVNDYSLFMNADGNANVAEKDLGHQMASQMLFFPGQTPERHSAVGASDAVACQAKKSKTDMIVGQEFDSVRTFDSLLPGDYQVATSKNVAAGVPDLSQAEHLDKSDQQQPDVFARPVLQTDETAHQIALTAEYFEDIDVQTQHGAFKYKCRICGHMLKPQSNLTEHLGGHFGGQKSFGEEAGAVPSVVGDGTACLGCNSKFRNSLELQHHLEANPEHLTPQPWDQN